MTSQLGKIPSKKKTSSTFRMFWWKYKLNVQSKWTLLDFRRKIKIVLYPTVKWCSNIFSLKFVCKYYQWTLVIRQNLLLFPKIVFYFSLSSVLTHFALVEVTYNPLRIILKKTVFPIYTNYLLHKIPTKLFNANKVYKTMEHPWPFSHTHTINSFRIIS